jgi:hypothetical protein
LPWVGIGASKFHDWKARFGKVNEHNAWVPRDHWLTEPEKEAIRVFARQHPLEGYRRQTFMMLDIDVVACSPTSVYRVLKAAGLLAGPTPTPTQKGTGFVQPLEPHEHGHVDVSYLNIAGTFFFLAPSSTAAAASSFTGKSVRKWRKATWKPSSNAPARSSPARRRGSSPTTGRSSSPRTARSSSACAA